MTKAELTRLALELPIDDQLDLAQTLREHASPPADFTLSPKLEELLDERIREAEANPNDGITWEELEARLRNQEVLPTIPFPPKLHERLTRLAELRGTSLGELVRRACEIQYGLLPVEARLEAVRELASFSLPVGSPEEMERESVPTAEELLP